MSSTLALISQLVEGIARVPFAIAVLTKGTLLVVLAICLTRLLGRAPAAARHLVWSLSVAGLLLLPASSWFPWQLELPALAVARDALGVRQSGSPSDARGRSNRAGDRLAAVAADEESTRNAERSPDGVTPATNDMTPSLTNEASLGLAAATSIRRFIAPTTMLMVLWLGGVAWMLGRLVVGVAAVRGMVRRSVPAAGGEWDELMEDVRARLDVGPVAGVVISSHAAMPFTYGLFRPVIVLPASAEEWTTERCRSVLLHELAHVRRRDLLTNAVVQIACVVYWFHPLVWLAARRVRIEAERACDALVVRAGMLPSDYAGDLLEIARTMRSSSTAAVALAMARRSDFEGRLLAILAPNSGRNVLTAARAAAIALAFAAPAAAVAAAVPPRAPTPNASASAPSVATLDEGVDEQAAPDRQAARPQARPNPDPSPEPKEDGEQGPAAQGRDRAVPALLGVVRDENVNVRLAAVQALGQLSDPRAIDALGEALRTDSDARVREAAASALGEIDSPRAVSALISALGSERVTAVRAKIAWALGEIEDPRAVEALGAAIRDGAAEVRQQVVWALGEIESPSAVPMLITALRDSDTETRKQAAWALGEIASADAVTALSAATKDADAEVRGQAVWALGEIEDVAALPALTAALGDAEVEVRRQAVEAIGSLELRSAPPGLIAALRDRDPEVQQAAAEALGSLEDAAAVPALIPLTRSDNTDVKRAAVQALADIGGEAAIEAIVVLLKDQDPEIRKIAAEALGKNR
jgi:HEAT repeat protein/beta-lactamase regulating signal transducer with metallopeptidase domain